MSRDQTDGRRWIDFFPDKACWLRCGARLAGGGRNWSRLVRRHLPIVALQTWLKLARIAHGPLFRVTGQGKVVEAEQLNGQEVVRLVKRAALAAGVRGDSSDAEAGQKFSGHSLRAGLASSAEVGERYEQKQLRHASAEMTRKYRRRRDRCRLTLTKDCRVRFAPSRS